MSNILRFSHPPSIMFTVPRDQLLPKELLRPEQEEGKLNSRIQEFKNFQDNFRNSHG